MNAEKETETVFCSLPTDTVPDFLRVCDFKLHQIFFCDFIKYKKVDMYWFLILRRQG